MIAHREEKACADVPGGTKKRDAILFLPISVIDERRFADLKNSPPRSQTEGAAKLQPAFPITN